MIRRIPSGGYRLYSNKKDKSGKRRMLGNLKTRLAAEQIERVLQFFKRR
jgi:hypothetical protein